VQETVRNLRTLVLDEKAMSETRPKSSEIRIRAARPDDLSFVLAAAERLPSFGPPAWRNAGEIVEGEARTLRAFFESPPPGAALLVAETPEGPLGIVYLETLRDYYTGEEHGHIGILSVIAEGEGKGVGGALMRAAEQWARRNGYRKLTLNVFDGNRHARLVYEHLGYAPETLRYLKVLGP
jgi:GNAT superfamily N-acetyltransferase